MHEILLAWGDAMSNGESRRTGTDPSTRNGAEDTGRELLRLGRKGVTADASAVRWRLSGGDEWSVLSSYGFNPSFPSRVRMEATSPDVVTDLTAPAGAGKPSAPYRQEGMRSLLQVGLPVRGEPRGALIFCARETGRYGEAELEEARVLVGPAGRALAAVVLEAELTEMRTTAEGSAAHVLQLADSGREMEETARQQRALYEAAERLATIVAFSDDAIVSKDLNGGVRSWNQAAERIFGYTAEEMIGQPIARIVPPDRPDEEPSILARLRRGERIDHFEAVRMRKDGQLIDISVTISP